MRADNRTTFSYLPESTRSRFVAMETNENIDVKRIALGEEQSYFAHYHKGFVRTKCYCASRPTGPIDRHFC